MQTMMRSRMNQARPPRRWRGGIVVGFAVATLAALATAYGLGLPPGLARFAAHAESGPLALASIGAGGRSTTITVSTPNSNDCRRYHLNMTTAPPIAPATPMGRPGRKRSQSPSAIAEGPMGGPAAQA
jgi:hypothetical protein